MYSKPTDKPAVRVKGKILEYNSLIMFATPQDFTVAYIRVFLL